MARGILKRSVQQLAARLGYRIVASEGLVQLMDAADRGNRLSLVGHVPDAELRAAFEALADAPSQLGQDIFVLGQLAWKRNGYYVEFGATDGRTLSNTWLLDRKFGWSGILAEPARVWRDRLIAEQRNAKLELDCVWKETGRTLTFNETEFAEISTVEEFKSRDHHDRSSASTYKVTTISLLDLLLKHDAPQVIDYLSIDTEGSEFTILEAFDFSRFRFRCITCEHNFTSDRERIHALLSAQGYRRVHENLSQFDDWYVSDDGSRLATDFGPIIP